jgi:hypothetical protein
MTLWEAGILIFLAGFGASFGSAAFFFTHINTLNARISKLEYEDKQNRTRINLLIDMARREGRDVPAALNIDAEGDVIVRGDVTGGSKRQGD